MPPSELWIDEHLQPNGIWELRLYNSSGAGVNGVHYDPLFLDVVPPVDGDDSSMGEAECGSESEAGGVHRDSCVTQHSGGEDPANSKSGVSKSAAKTGGAARKPKWVNPAQLRGEDKHGLQLPTNDLEELEALSDCPSDRSDESDVFHAKVVPGAASTFEDVEQRRALKLSERLRDRPLMPPHPQDATRSWTDVRSGVKLPVAHCAFIGCAWTGNSSNEINAHVLHAHRADFESCCSLDFDTDDASW